VHGSLLLSAWLCAAGGSTCGVESSGPWVKAMRRRGNGRAGAARAARSRPTGTSAQSHPERHDGAWRRLGRPARRRSQSTRAVRVGLETERPERPTGTSCRARRQGQFRRGTTAADGAEQVRISPEKSVGELVRTASRTAAGGVAEDGGHVLCRLVEADADDRPTARGQRGAGPTVRTAGALTRCARRQRGEADDREATRASVGTRRSGSPAMAHEVGHRVARCGRDMHHGERDDDVDARVATSG